MAKKATAETIEVATQEIENFNKLVFRRLILLLVFLSILTTLIPTLFNFEKYYGLSRFIDQGFIEI